MLKSFDSYVIALLKLIDGLPRRQGRSRDILELFGERYDDEISPAHRRKNSSGRVVWIVRTQWSRQRALSFGLIDSPARGIWRLTDAGHRWLEEHPNATRVEGIKAKRQRASSDESDEKGGNKFKAWLSEAKIVPESVLPKAIQSTGVKFNIRNDRLYIKIRTIKKCHYEICLHDDYHEIALHFQNSKPARNQALLRAFEPHLDAITEKFQQSLHELIQKANGSLDFLLQPKYDWSVRADTWGPDDKWARVWIRLPGEVPLPEGRPLVYGFVVVYLVEATWDIFKPAYEAVRQGITNIAPKGRTNGYYAMLDREIAAIRAFLQGRSDHRPSDEKLCDWVQFCYLFEMYTEGRNLFALVSPDAINPWYLERTRKIARICTLKANPNG